MTGMRRKKVIKIINLKLNIETYIWIDIGKLELNPLKKEASQAGVHRRPGYKKRELDLWRWLTRQ